MVFIFFSVKPILDFLKNIYLLTIPFKYNILVNFNTLLVLQENYCNKGFRRTFPEWNSESEGSGIPN